MIMSLEAMTDMLERYHNRKKLGKIVCTSGGFDPIHSGHISCIKQSKLQHANTLIVIVNGDGFLTRKKGKPFMPLEERVKIVDSIKHVSYTVPYEADEDGVCGALEAIKPHVYTKGGPYKAEEIREYETCTRLGIRIVAEVGDQKIQGSSDYLLDWGLYSISAYHQDMKRALTPKQGFVDICNC